MASCRHPADGQTRRSSLRADGSSCSRCRTISGLNRSFGLLAGRCLDRVSRRSFQETIMRQQLVGPGLVREVGRISEGGCSPASSQQSRFAVSAIVVPTSGRICSSQVRSLFSAILVSPRSRISCGSRPECKRDSLVQVLADPLCVQALPLRWRTGIQPYWPARPSSHGSPTGRRGRCPLLPCTRRRSGRWCHRRPDRLIEKLIGC